MKRLSTFLCTLALLFGVVGVANANHYVVYSNGAAGENGWDKQAVVTLNASLVAGTEYVLRAKVKSETATTEQIQPVPIFSTSENKDAWGNSADVQYLEGRSVTTEFVEQVWYFTAAFTHDKIQFFIGKIGGNVYFDDVSLKVKDADTEFINNGNFESPGISNWGTNWGGPSFTQDCDIPNADFVMIYENGAAGENGWDKQAVVTLNASLVAGTEYVLRAKVKSETATTEQIQPVPIFSTSENKDAWGNSADVQYLEGRSVTTEFVEQVWYFTAAFTHDKIQFFIGKIGGNVYFDDVSLKVKDADTEFINNGSITNTNISNWGKNWGGPSFYRWDYSVPATVGSDGFATFSAVKAINVDGIVTAYGAKYDGSKIVLTPVTEIPANTGVIIEAAAGTYTIPAINSASALGSINELLVSDGSVKGNGTSIYALGKKGGKVGFVLVKENSTIPAGKAYLDITAPGRDFIGFGDEDATGIEAVRQNAMADNQYFNIAGQRVAQPTKGLYIVNGKKVIIK